MVAASAMRTILRINWASLIRIADSRTLQRDSSHRLPRRAWSPLRQKSYACLAWSAGFAARGGYGAPPSCSRASRSRPSSRTRLDEILSKTGAILRDLSISKLFEWRPRESSRSRLPAGAGPPHSLLPLDLIALNLPDRKISIARRNGGSLVGQSQAVTASASDTHLRLKAIPTRRREQARLPAWRDALSHRAPHVRPWRSVDAVSIATSRFFSAS